MDEENKENKDNNKESKNTNYLALGISLGLVFGVAIKNVGIGLALGVAIGAGLENKKS